MTKVNRSHSVCVGVVVVVAVVVVAVVAVVVGVVGVGVVVVVLNNCFASSDPHPDILFRHSIWHRF